jgi:hypothetical protein
MDRGSAVAQGRARQRLARRPPVASVQALRESPFLIDTAAIKIRFNFLQISGLHFSNRHKSRPAITCPYELKRPPEKRGAATEKRQGCRAEDRGATLEG